MMGMTKYERICQPLVAVVACGLNIPPLVLGLVASANWCHYYGKFLAPNAFFCFVNVIAAFFSIYKLRRAIQFDVRYNADDDDDDNAMHGMNVSTTSPQGQQSMVTVATNGATINNSNNHDNKNNGNSPPIFIQSDIAAKELDCACDPRDDKEPKAGIVEDPEIQVKLSSAANTTPLASLPAPRQEPTLNQNGSSNNEISCLRQCIKLRTKSSNRIRHLICYSGPITTYGILFLFWAFWLGSGEQLALESDTASDKRLEGCSEEALDLQYFYVTLSVVMGYGECKEESIDCCVWKD
jgi:hypothetical protein